MPDTRIYTPASLALNQTIDLDETAKNHLVRVLRMNTHDSFKVFNGQGQEFLAELVIESKKSAKAKIVELLREEAPCQLSLHLGQVISKGERMDFTIQKATELGIHTITPLWSERCDVRLKGERLEKKQQHWQRVAISACEQSGRNFVPSIQLAMNLEEWLRQTQADKKLLLHPHNQQPLDAESQPQSIALLVGPEGGFSDLEVNLSHQQGFEGLILGPRILRTETAALSALSVIQYVWGDFR